MRHYNDAMCGRYSTPQQSEAERYFAVHLLRWQFERSFNVAPTQRVPVVRAREGAREGTMMRWGLVPFFARGVAPRYSTINARIETLDSAPSYRGPWQRGQRCLIPAAGFFEWHLQDSGGKQPFFIHAADQPMFAMAGLWDRSRSADGSVLESCTIVTMPANALLAQIHNAPGKGRMPAVLPSGALDAWLNGSLEQAREVLQPYPAELLVAWPVSTRVNSPKNDDPELVAAVTG
ncbi:MAG: SOS response-associated peptidase [Steroidobacteraceae bacterium]